MASGLRFHSREAEARRGLTLSLTRFVTLRGLGAGRREGLGAKEPTGGSGSSNRKKSPRRQQGDSVSRGSTWSVGRWREGKQATGRRKRLRRVKFRESLKTIARRRSTHVTPSGPPALTRVGDSEWAGGISVKEITYWPAPCDGCKFLLSVPARSVEVWDFFARGCCEALPEVPRGIIACAL